MINTAGPRKHLSAVFTLLLVSHQERFPHYHPPPSASPATAFAAFPGFCQHQHPQ